MCHQNAVNKPLKNRFAVKNLIKSFRGDIFSLWNDSQDLHNSKQLLETAAHKRLTVPLLMNNISKMYCFEGVYKD